MSHINTLRIYEDLITSGIPEKQAKAQVHAIENFITDLATKDDLSSGASLAATRVAKSSLVNWSQFAPRMVCAIGSARMPRRLVHVIWPAYFDQSVWR